MILVFMTYALQGKIMGCCYLLYFAYQEGFFLPTFMTCTQAVRRFDIAGGIDSRYTYTGMVAQKS